MIRVRNILFYIWRIYRFIVDEVALEIHISDHCNLNCKSCTHYSPIAKQNYVDINSLSNELFIIKKKKIINFFSEIRLLGGEPLLNPNLIEILDIVRNIFPKKKINLITNGLLLNNMSNDFFNCCKRNNIKISITKYPCNIDYENLLKLMRDKGMNCIIYDDRTNNYSFYESKLSYKTKSIWRNFYNCFDQNCFQLKGGRLYSCPQSAHVDILNDYLKQKFTRNESDFIRIDDINYLKILKFRYLPKQFCRYCILPRKRFNWEKSTTHINEWVE